MEPQPHGGDVEHGQEGAGCLLIPRRDAAALFQATDHALDPVPQPVNIAVERPARRTVALERDHRLDATDQQILAQPVRIISLVTEKPLRPPLPKGEQIGGGPEIMNLATGEVERQRLAGRVGTNVNLGAEAASGATERLPAGGFFAPAACE